MTPYFLVHYAHAGGDASYVKRFFDDVQNAVYGLVGQRPEFTGCLAGTRGSVSSGGGECEPPEPSPPIMSCPVLVALYSDAYFSDRQCFLEWSLFRERVRWHHQFTGRRSSALVGVRWSVHAKETVRVLADADILIGAFGDHYQEAGALRLMRTEPTSGYYWNLVEQVAECITVNAGDPIPTMSDDDIQYIQALHGVIPSVPAPAAGARSPGSSALSSGGDDVGGGDERPGATADEPGVQPNQGVGVVLAVAPAHRQPARRTQRVYYGDDAADWRPFLPAAASSAFEIARNALEDYSYSSVVYVSLDDDLAGQLGRAAAEARILVVLVDPWIAASDTYARNLALLGEWRRRPSVAGTLVIVNPADGETRANVEDLRDRLRRALRRDREGTESRTWRDAVHTADDLAAQAIPLVARARNTLIGLSPEHRGRPSVPEQDSSAMDTAGDQQAERTGTTRTRPVDAKRSRRPILRRAGGGTRGGEDA